MDNTPKQKESFAKRFVKALIDLVEFCNKAENKAKPIDEVLQSYKVSDWDGDEALTKRLCEYVDNFYAQRLEFEKSKKKADVWLKGEIDKTINELSPDATDEEKKELKKLFVEGIDAKIETLANEVSANYDDVVI